MRQRGLCEASVVDAVVVAAAFVPLHHLIGELASDAVVKEIFGRS